MPDDCWGSPPLSGSAWYYTALSERLGDNQRGLGVAAAYPVHPRQYGTASHVRRGVCLWAPPDRSTTQTTRAPGDGQARGPAPGVAGAAAQSLSGLPELGAV